MEWRIINEYDQMDNYDVLIKSDETQWQYFCFASFQSKEEMTSAHIEIKIMS